MRSLLFMIHLKNEARNGLASVVSSEIPPKLTQPLLTRAKRCFLAKENRSGFTLIEVLLAVAIVGIVLGPIYILQSTVFERVVRSAGAVDRMLAAYDFFVDAQNGDEDNVKETIRDPETDMTYAKKEPEKSSILAKEFNHIYIKKLSWHWKYQEMSYGDVLVYFAFIPPEEKQEVAQETMADSQGREKKAQPAGASQKVDEKKSDEKKEQKSFDTTSQKGGHSG